MGFRVQGLAAFGQEPLEIGVHTFRGPLLAYGWKGAEFSKYKPNMESTIFISKAIEPVLRVTAMQGYQALQILKVRVGALSTIGMCRHSAEIAGLSIQNSIPQSLHPNS